jgi:hypothetical protein
MRVRLDFAAVLLAAFATSASAQALYRCQEGGRVTYSDRACTAGSVTPVPVDVGPSTEEQAAAAARLRQDVADFQARWAATQGGRSAPQGASRKSAAQGGSGVNAVAVAADGRCEPRMIGAVPQSPAAAGGLYVSSASRRY